MVLTLVLLGIVTVMVVSISKIGVLQTRSLDKLNHEELVFQLVQGELIAQTKFYRRWDDEKIKLKPGVIDKDCSSQTGQLLPRFLSCIILGQGRHEEGEDNFRVELFPLANKDDLANAGIDDFRVWIGGFIVGKNYNLSVTDRFPIFQRSLCENIGNSENRGCANFFILVEATYDDGRVYQQITGFGQNIST